MSVWAMTRLTLTLAACALFTGPALASDPDPLPRNEAVAAAQKVIAGLCPGSEVGPEPKVHEQTRQWPGSDRIERLQLVFLTCSTGAYNITKAAVIVDDYENATLQPFSLPTYDIEYADEEETKVKSITMTGMTATHFVTNGVYDDEASTLATNACWRGLCDASDNATYRWTRDGFVLERFAVDPTYDGQSTPTTIYERDRP